MALKEKISQPDEGSSEPREVDEVELYLEAVGGLKMQRVYGLGSEASSVYSHYSFTSASTTSRAQQEALEEEVRQLRETVSAQQIQLQQQQTQMQEQIRILMQEEMRKMRAEFYSSQN